jgi:hypothetical protein
MPNSRLSIMATSRSCVAPKGERPDDQTAAVTTEFNPPCAADRGRAARGMAAMGRATEGFFGPIEFRP